MIKSKWTYLHENYHSIYIIELQYYLILYDLLFLKHDIK
jgi:hypothetical protein